MKSVIGILLGLAVMPVIAENAATGRPSASATTPAALLKSAEENIAAQNNEAAGMLAPPAAEPSRDPAGAAKRGPEASNGPALIPPPPPFQPQTAAPAVSKPPAAAASKPIVTTKALPAIFARPVPAAVNAPAGPLDPSTSSAVAPALPMPKKALAGDFAGPDVAVILARNQFFPSTIRVHSGNPTRLLFTTVNRKPGALILERMQVQRWIPGEPASEPLTESERAKQEVDRELNAQKITEIVIDPKPGSYTFYDALSGAAGEIIVE